MNTEYILNRWVPALRSDEYQQGHGMLKSIVDGNVTHCCLGVVCEELVKDGVLPAWVTRQSGHGGGSQMIQGSYMYLPPEAITFLGLGSGDPDVEFSELFGDTIGEGGDAVDTLSLTEANDDQGISFAGIANALEEMALAHLREESR